MNRRAWMRSLAAILPLGLAAKLFGKADPPPQQADNDQGGVWGALYVFYDGEVHQHAIKEQCTNDFARRAIQLHPKLATTAAASILLWLGKVQLLDGPPPDEVWVKQPPKDANLWLDMRTRRVATF